MRKATLAASALAFAAILCSAIPAAAQTVYQPNQPKILLHMTAPTTKSPCVFGLNSLGGSCLNADVTGLSDPTGATSSYFVYVVVVKGDSMLDLAGFQLGIDYDQEYAHNATSDNDGQGIDMFGWFLCATLQFASPEWTGTAAEPLSGNLITWDSTNACQVGPVSIAGYFYVAAYGPTEMYIIPRPVDNVAKVADCQAAESEAIPTISLGWAAFSAAGNVPGCNPCVGPCGIVPTVPTTWGSIKALGNN
jgi:hypothetical protein